MEDLRLVGVQEDGTHLLLEGAPGTRYRVRVNEQLRAAARQDRVRLGQLQIELDAGMRPRDIQAMVRSGATADEVAARSGWSLEKVERFEGPIRAERRHVAELARGVRIRTRASGAGPEPATLGGRVQSRMRSRDVDPATSEWDAWRDPGDAHWTVAVSFEAGDRTRRGHWSFDLGTRGLTARDDEARWLSEDEAAPVDTVVPGSGSARATSVYDVEAEGGVDPEAGHRPAVHAPPLDLMTAMRQRSAARGRGGRRGPAAPTHIPGEEQIPDDARPVADLGYDVERHGLPPAAHPRPARDSRDSRDSRETRDPREPRRRRGRGERSTTSVGDLFADADSHEYDVDEPPTDATGPTGSTSPVAETASEPTGRPVERTEELELAVERPSDERLSAEKPSAKTVSGPGEESDGVPSPLGVVSTTAKPAPSAPGRRSRATVPSWDDIMFGGSRD